MKFLFIFFMGYCCAFVWCEQQVFSIEHIPRLKNVSSCEISPDGTKIAYTLSNPRRPFVDEDGSAWKELHIVDLLGNTTPFVCGKVHVDNIHWKPDASGISFISKRDDDASASLYFIAINGGEARKILEHDSDIQKHCWNHDGTEIIFLAKEIQTEKERLEKHGFHQNIYEEDAISTKVWIGKPQFILDSWQEKTYNIRKLNIHGSCSEIKCSPNGKYLAVAVAPTSLTDDYYMKRKIKIYNLIENEIVTELKSQGKLGTFEWSPNSEHIAVIAAASINDPIDGRLFVGSFAQPELQNILPLYEGKVTSIQWQDKQTIMFTGDERVWSTFNKVKLDGLGFKTIVPRKNNHLTSFSIAKNGFSGAFLCDSWEHPQEVFTMAHGELEPRKLTNSNPWLDKIKLASQRVVSYKSKDGLEVDGLLIEPLDKKDDKKYPLVLIVHGGPESHFSNGWLTSYSRPGQLLAANGFAVFYPNYRGSTGRGVVFASMGQGDTGGAEFEDLIDGVDYLIETGLIDKDKVGVTGGSYGGFATAWCSTYYSERFAAGVMSVGISEQISKFGTTDIPNEMYFVHTLKWPWDNWEFFRERSPLSHFQKCRTPLLIAHGERDKRVNPSQSMILYRYIKTLGKSPVRLVLYPNEGHGNRKAASQLDYSLRLLRWMKHYLQEEGGTPPEYALDYSSFENK